MQGKSRIDVKRFAAAFRMRDDNRMHGVLRGLIGIFKHVIHLGAIVRLVAKYMSARMHGFHAFQGLFQARR